MTAVATRYLPHVAAWGGRFLAASTTSFRRNLPGNTGKNCLYHCRLRWVVGTDFYD